MPSHPLEVVHICPRDPSRYFLTVELLLLDHEVEVVSLSHARPQLPPLLAHVDQTLLLLALFPSQHVVRRHHPVLLGLEVEAFDERPQPLLPLLAAADPHRFHEVVDRRLAVVVHGTGLGPLFDGGLIVQLRLAHPLHDLGVRVAERCLVRRAVGVGLVPLVRQVVDRVPAQLHVDVQGDGRELDGQGTQHVVREVERVQPRPAHHAVVDVLHQIRAEVEILEGGQRGDGERQFAQPVASQAKVGEIE
mmetsp:Transcript_7241/g.18415  ORF Transcript_7241/g.18415 Transcript_7241/m.18415 type:complete len:248 (+) Transcript_7241:502-1245(+)